MQFPHLSKSELLAQFARVSPTKYASSRNYLNGAVTKLSPYITPEQVTNLLSRYSPEACDSLYKELIWKEYFTQVLAHQGE
jgi:deoxyribodipyrimidine photo-lyase